MSRWSARGQCRKWVSIGGGRDVSASCDDLPSGNSREVGLLDRPSVGGPRTLRVVKRACGRIGGRRDLRRDGCGW